MVNVLECLLVNVHAFIGHNKVRIERALRLARFSLCVTCTRHVHTTKCTLACQTLLGTAVSALDSDHRGLGTDP